MKSTPRGIRDNNPMCVRTDHTGRNAWVGLVGDDEGYCRFDTPEHGIRAGTEILRNYQGEHRLFTIAGMISRWAPREDANDTAAYIGNVCRALGVHGNDLYPLTPIRAVPLVAAMIHQECGDNGRAPWYPNTLIRVGVDMAFV